MPRRTARTPDEAPQLKGGMARQSEDDRPARRGAPIMGPLRARPGSGPKGAASVTSGGAVDALPDNNMAGGASHPILAVAAYGEGARRQRLFDADDPNAGDPATPIPFHEPDDPEVLRRLFGV